MTEWVITCDATKYDVEGALTNLIKVDWVQNNNINEGDMVYIYVGKPISAIRYKCQVNKVDMLEPEIDDSMYILDDSFEETGDRYMEIELLEHCDDSSLDLKKIRENGLRQVRSSSRVTEEFHDYIDEIMLNKHNLSKKKSRAQKITILMQAFARPITARELMNIIYPDSKYESQVSDELRYLTQIKKIIRTGAPQQYYYELPEMTNRSYFYVMQNKTYLEELEGEYIWAPQKNDVGEDGAHHWKRMRDVKKGDIILHGFKQQVVAVSVAKTDCYSASRPDEITDDWHNDGWKVDLDYYCFENPIRPKDIWEELRPIQPSKYAPLDRNGNGNEGYLFAANLNICQCILNNIAKNGAPGVNATSTHTFEKASKIVNKTLQIKISEYDKVVRDGEPELILKANKFINDYNYQKLKSITKEQYVIGTGKKDTFCYRVTYELDGLGSIRSGTPNKYGFYYSAYGDDREMKYRTNKVFGDTNSDGAIEDAFNNVKRAIFDLLVAGNHNDYKAIEDNPLSTIFKGKLLCIYYPDQYLNVYSEEHAKYYMGKLGIEVDESKGIMEWLQQMITWKNEDPVAKNWTNHEFSKFLYHGIGYPPDSEKQKSALRIYEKKVDNELIDAIEDTPESDLPQKEDYIPTPEDRKNPIVIGENYSYPRNKVIALKALKRANYDCEIDNGHPSFMRKTNGTKYTEPHHLVPMSEQDRYENSLDVQANIVSLCSNCHNELHYGQNPEPLLRKLYTNRKGELKAAGISISFDDLISLYL